MSDFDEDDYEDLRGSDAFNARGLDPRRGDDQIAYHDANSRWGSTAQIPPGGTATLILTRETPINEPIAYQLRFAETPSGPFTPALTANASTGAIINLLKSVDVKAGAANEQFSLFPGQTQPSCVLICRKLVITIQNLSQPGTDPGDNVTLYVEAAACPVTNVDCGEIVPDETTGGYPNATTVSFTASTDITTFLAANTARKQFFLQNLSTNATLFFCLGTINPEVPIALSLPPGLSAIYESPLNGYTGVVQGVWVTTIGSDDPDGQAVVTEGTT
jgi:hypothetical protein